jgi:hypothetical protein
MRASTVWVLVLAVLLTAHGGFTIASTLVLEDKVARLQAIVDVQGDASTDLSSCTELLSRAVRNERANSFATRVGPSADEPLQSPKEAILSASAQR